MGWRGVTEPTCGVSHAVVRPSILQVVFRMCLGPKAAAVSSWPMTQQTLSEFLACEKEQALIGTVSHAMGGFR